MVDRLDATEVESLVEDLRRCQVAAEAHLAGGAEGAGERTARLRRQTERASSVAVAHQHRLDGMTLARPEQCLHGPVARLRLPLELERRERNLLLGPPTGPARKVRHPRVAPNAASPPTPPLAGTVCRLPALAQPPLQKRTIHPGRVAPRLR